MNNVDRIAYSSIAANEAIAFAKWLAENWMPECEKGQLKYWDFQQWDKRSKEKFSTESLYQLFKSELNPE